MSKMFLNENGRTSKYCLLALSLTIANTGPLFYWNTGLSAGIGTYGFVLFSVGLAYICLCLCTSELSSAFPFAGGSYGLARCTLGYYLGFIVGCYETIYAIFSTSFAISFLAEILSQIFGTGSSFLPLYFLPLYGIPILIVSMSKRWVWVSCAVVATLSSTIVIVYCLSTLSLVNAHKYADTKHAFHGNFVSYLTLLPLGIFLFTGPEILNLCCNEVEFPRTEVPWAQVTAAIYLFLQSICVFFISACAAPGIQELSMAVSPVADSKCDNDTLVL